MNYKQVIGEAWEFTQNNRKMIIWYAFFPALLTTMAGILYLGYQFLAFKSSPLFENWDQGFGYLLVTTVLQVIGDNFESTIPFIIAGGVILMLYVTIPPLCEGAIIQLVARKKNGQEVRTRDGIKHGMLSFLPLFEYSWLVRTFSLVAILSEAAFVARNLGWDALKALTPVLIIFTIVGILLTLLFTYTEFFIVIDDRKVFASIVKSCRLVITHLEATILLSILMLIIGIRILLQIFFVLLIPGIIAGSIYLFASSAYSLIGIIVGGALGLILLYIASYLSAIVHVFAATVWTFTFLEFTSEENLSARVKVAEPREENSREENARGKNS